MPKQNQPKEEKREKADASWADVFDKSLQWNIYHSMNERIMKIKQKREQNETENSIDKHNEDGI